MRQRSRYFVAVSLAIVLAMTLMVAGCGGEEAEKPAEEQKEPYKIGAVVSLTGTYAGLGGPEKNVLDMEVARINADGGVNGHPIEVIIEDDATDEAKAVQATTKLIDQDGVMAIIGATGTGQTMAMGGDVEKAGIAQVSMAGGTVITDPLRPLVFATPWSNKIVMPFLAKYLQAQGVKTIGIIGDTGGFGKDGIAVLEKTLPDYGITVAAKETFNPGDADMTAQLTKIKGASPDAIVLVSAGKEASTVAKNAEQLKLGIPLYGTHGNARKEFIEGAGTAAEGFIFPAGKILIPSSYGEGSEGFTVATEFIDRYKSEYAGEEPNTFAGHAYDALYLIVEAMKRLPEGFTAADLRDEIEKTSGWQGIGGKFTFSATDHNGMTEDDLVMYEVKDGAWVLK